MTSSSAPAPGATGRVRRVPLGVPDRRAAQTMVPMRDGVRLATDVYLPDRPRRHPVVLIRLPYDKNGEFSFMAPLAHRLTAEGFAVVVQDVRGKARSEGETYAFVHETADGADTLDWVVTQPWCDGAVGMFGDSYYGFTQWAAVASGHPALRAVVPRMTTTEVGTDWMYCDGVFNTATMLEWAVHAWAEPALIDHDLDWSLRPVVDIVPAALDGARSRSFDDWIRYPPGHPFWREQVFGGPPPALGRVPTLHVGGFYDVFSRGQLRDHARSLRGDRPHDQFLVMGASDHFDDEVTRAGTVPDYALDAARLDTFLGRDYLGPALPFLRRYLTGRDESVPAVRWQQGWAGWSETTRWPPPGARALELYPAGAHRALLGPLGGDLAPSPEAHGSEVGWLHDPARPVPTAVEDPWRPLLRLPDEREVQSRDDVLTFTGEQADRPLVLAGPVRLHAVLAARATSTHLVARLCDVAPDGYTRLVVEGARLVRTDGDPTATVVDLGDTGYRLEPGHRLRLAVSTSSWPRYAVHLGDDRDPMTALLGPAVPQRLLLGRPSGTRLTLTVLPDTE